MKVRWTSRAFEDLEEIDTYVREKTPSFWPSTTRKLFEGTQSLRRLPRRGHAGAKPGTLEIILLPLPFILIYRIDEDVVEILGFRHTARDQSIH